MNSTGREISNYVYRHMRCKYNLDVFPFCCGLLVDFVCVPLNEASSLPTGNQYVFVNVTDRIQYTNFKSKYCILFYPRWD